MLAFALAAGLACTGASAPEGEVPVPEPTGSIGGEPILPKPVVLGAIAAGDVASALEARAAEIHGCYETERRKDPTLAGKVLLQFSIGRDGTVGGVATKSTSLRNATAVDCVKALVAEVKFPALTDGESALVMYPFTFP